MKFSDRLLRLKPSATLAMSEKALQMKAEGKRCIMLSVGEPDFPSPAAAFRYAEKAMQEGHTRYTQTNGIKELRAAVIEYYKKYHGLTYAQNEICVAAGAKPLLFEVFGALLNAGDEVIVPTPAWVSYVEQIDVFDGKSVLIDTSESNFMPDLTAIANAITPRTKAILINNPHNPTGVVYSRELAANLCRLAHKHGVMLINDEIYERMVFGLEYRNPVADAPETRDSVLTINGVSKTYAMTGWRIGFALGPSALIAKMGALQGHMTACACSIAQWAAVGAILEGQQEADAMVAEYAKRLAYIDGRLSAMPSIALVKPQGAFYAFIDVRKTIGKKFNGKTITDDLTFCEELLGHGVALVPGTAFLAPGFARLSYAASMADLTDAMDIMQDFLEKLE